MAVESENDGTRCAGRMDWKGGWRKAKSGVGGIGGREAMYGDARRGTAGDRRRTARGEKA